MEIGFFSTNCENISFGFAMLDNKLSIRKFNNRIACMLNQQSNDLTGEFILNIFPEMSIFKFSKNHEFNKLHRDNGQTIAVDLVQIENSKEPSYFIFCRDLTKYEGLKTQLSQLNDQTIMYSKMFNVLSDGIYITDGQGVTLYVNDAFLQLSGLKREAVIGKDVFALRETGVVPNSCAATVLYNRKPATVINDYYGGKKCLVSGTPVYINDELIRVVCVIRDVTELIELQDMVAKEKSLALCYKKKLKEYEAIQIDMNLIKTQSKSMQDIYDKAMKIAKYDSPVLLLGETGVGKDYLANFIHKICGRGNDNCLIKVNCGAIPEHLLESELFGYEPGAFTGAHKQGKAGLFELANNGTLYLDEIGDMPLSLQVKLLNALQDKKIYRLGGTKTIKLTARIIAATNANISRLIEEGKFRRDLYYRLNIITITIPPLRERREDIVHMAINFLEQFNKQYNKTCCFSPKTLEMFLSYDWPGNIREMRNIIERMVIVANQDCIEINSFDSKFLESLNLKNSTDYAYTYNNTASVINKQTLKESLYMFEEKLLREAIEFHSTLKEAAQTLDIDLSTLVRKQQKYNISKVAKEKN